MRIGGRGSWGETFARFLPHNPFYNAPSLACRWSADCGIPPPYRASEFGAQPLPIDSSIEPPHWLTGTGVAQMIRCA